MITFTVDGPPKGKGRPRFVRKTGRAYTPDATLNYEAVIRLAAQQAMAGRELLTGPVQFEALATFAMPASWSKAKRELALSGSVRPTVKPDTDNISKLKDALNGVVWVDDAQVVTEWVVKDYGDKPNLTINVVPL